MPDAMGTVSKQRVDWVDTAKGICIIMVVMVHATLGVELAAGAEGWMHYVVSWARPFRMPDFFLISGLFLGLVIDRPWLRYLDRKVVHFAYFYVLWLTIPFAFKAPGMAMEEGAAGILAVIAVAVMVSRLHAFNWLRWLGEHSIVVYLAFFLPMATTRVVLLKTGLIPDIGTMSLITTAAGVIGPCILYALVQWTGRGKFLFERPRWAHIDVPATGRAATA